jgi:hypothetical protein
LLKDKISAIPKIRREPSWVFWDSKWGDGERKKQGFGALKMEPWWRIFMGIRRFRFFGKGIKCEG